MRDDSRRKWVNWGVRLFWIFFALALLFLVPFLVWGERFDGWFSGDAAVEWLRGYGGWAWAAGVILLALDLFLPIPGTAVMAALGLIYGALVGGLIAAAGSVLSGLLAYALCRGLGRSAARRIVGEKGLAESEALFGRAGGWMVVLSRWLPLVPEVVACMAGLARMRLRVFFVALVCGSVPLAFVFSAIGAAGANRPVAALVVSMVLPPLLWFLVRPIFLRRAKSGG